MQVKYHIRKFFHVLLGGSVCPKCGDLHWYKRGSVCLTCANIIISNIQVKTMEQIISELSGTGSHEALAAKEKRWQGELIKRSRSK